jgi:hypothetical protein
VAQSLGSQINLSVFLGLLVLTVLVMLALGFASYHQRLYSDIVFSVVIVTGILIGWDERRLFPVAVCTGIIALSVTWASWWIATNSLELWREVFTVLVVVMIQWVLMVQIFRPGPITAVRIQGALAVYLLFGISWAYGYVILMHLNPHAFQSTIGLTQAPAEWMYFSFVTLTTLGYGEITPLSNSGSIAGDWRGIDRATLSRRVVGKIGSDGNYVSEGGEHGRNVTESRGSYPTDAVQPQS